MKKHTPGPWAVKSPTHFVDGLAHMVVSDNPQEGYWHVAELGVHNGRAESEANARLIAAAPEMLDILESVIAVYGDNCGDGCIKGECCICRTRAIIAKADGV